MGRDFCHRMAVTTSLLAASLVFGFDAHAAEVQRITDPVGDPVNFDGAIDPDGELDIERAQFGASPFSDDDFYISVKTACCKNEVVGWENPSYR